MMVPRFPIWAHEWTFHGRLVWCRRCGVNYLDRRGGCAEPPYEDDGKEPVIVLSTR